MLPVNTSQLLTNCFLRHFKCNVIVAILLRLVLENVPRYCYTIFNLMTLGFESEYVIDSGITVLLACLSQLSLNVALYLQAKADVTNVAYGIMFYTKPTVYSTCINYIMELCMLICPWDCHTLCAFCSPETPGEGRETNQLRRQEVE